MQRGRATLQANDLLDIVDFIKNEEKYSARIKELQEHEANLNEKLRIVSTLEDAEALEQKFIEAKKRIDESKIVLQKEYEDLKSKLRDEHAGKLATVEERAANVRTLHDVVAKQMNEVKAIGIAQNAEKYRLDEIGKKLDIRTNDVTARENVWKNKVLQLNTILGL